MKKLIILSILLMCLITVSRSEGLPQNSDALIDKIKLSQEDIPEGYMYGIIPEWAKTVLKNNPWDMDRAAIQRLSDKIYPGGDYNQITAIHVTIFARKETPHGDDIVCYIIQYKDLASAKNEIRKISEYTGYNGDRAILNVKDNIAVFLHVDDKNDFHYIQEIDKKIKEKMKNI